MEEPQEIVWKEDNSRFICFLDIMGFKDMVYSLSHEDVKKKMKGLSDTGKFIIKKTEVLKKGEIMPEYKDCEVKLASFSDSLILFTNEDKINDFLLITYAAKKILRDALKLGIPIKGAISYGHLTADFEKSIFLGKPLINAFLLQEKLQYYGVVLDHNAEVFYKENESKYKGHDIYHFLKTPFKGGHITHANISLPDSDIRKEDYENLYKTVSGPVRLYVDNTIQVYEKMATSR